VSDRAALVLAVATIAGAWAALAVPVVVGVAVVGLAFALRRPWVLCLGSALLASGLAARSWAGLEPPASGASFEGVVTLVTDPEPFGRSVRAEVRAGAVRMEAWAAGPAAWRLEDRLAGERVELTGRVRPLTGDARGRLAYRHIARRLSVSEVGDWSPGDVVSRAANGLRRTLLDGAESLPEERRSLFAGFVLGDDRNQPPDLADDFRAAGLGHLLAVSGQNVAFVLAVGAPLLRRFGLRARCGATIGLIAFFAVVTRWEPSVLRASAMAALAVVAATMGRQASGLRLLALAVTGLVLLDPLLIRSVGFQLSAAASAGILLLSGPLSRALPGPRPVAGAAAVTLAAQVGVAPVLVPVFGGLPVAALPANLLAVPAAGPVMVWGMTGGLAAGLVGGRLAGIAHVPTSLLTGWVAGVARWSAGLGLGDLRAVHLAWLGVAGAAALVPRRRAHLGTAAALGAVVTSLVLIAAWRDGHAARPLDEPVPGARLWRGGGATVLAVDSAPPARLLESVRNAGVRSLDVLLVRRASADAEPIARALRPRLVLGPLGCVVPGAVAPSAGTRLVVGGLVLHVRQVQPHLVVDVRSRAPPGRAIPPVYRPSPCSSGCGSETAPTTSPRARW
jgi:competence protein ComEC